VEYDLREVQLCQLEILKEVKRLCEENNIAYCLACGSCLGAIRHKGFIPWDDDIDIFMPYEDLLRFNQLNSKIKEPYFIQNLQTEPGYRVFTTKVRNSNTTFILNAEEKTEINQGVSIDIYPLFNSPDGKLRNLWQTVNSYVYRLLLYGEPPENHGKVIAFFAGIAMRLLPKSIMKFSFRQMTKYPQGKLLSELFVSPFERFSRGGVFPFGLAEFEGLEVPVPKDAIGYLSQHYGSDWRELPPEEERNIHVKRKVGNVVAKEAAIVDLQHSYKMYQEENGW
jgi:lipopolysaccharide cholinephosphotransferase